MGALASVSRREAQAVEEIADVSEAVESYVDITPNDQSHIDVILRKVNCSPRFRHLKESIRQMIAKDLSIPAKFLRSYFNIKYVPNMRLDLVVCEIPNKLTNYEGMYHTGLVLGNT